MGGKLRRRIKEFLIIALLSFEAHALECNKVASVCLQGAETRTIDGFSVHRDCWKYEDTFDCKPGDMNTCQSLIDEGCYQVGSECLKEIKGKCVHFKQKYVCARTKETEFDEEILRQKTDKLEDFLKDIKCKSDINCGDGSCVDSSYKANDELFEAMSRLSVLKEIKGNVSTGNFEIFKGESSTCKTDVAGFRNCCNLRRDKGWGKDLHIVGCSDREEQLRKSRNNNQCVYVGEYCAVRDPVFKSCLEKKSSFCCFSSDLIRIIQEEGRKQLALNFGTAKEPECRGFTEDELNRLKFEEMNLSEIYKRWQNVNSPDFKIVSRDLQNEMKKMQGSSSNSGANPKQAEVNEKTNTGGM